MHRYIVYCKYWHNMVMQKRQARLTNLASYPVSSTIRRELVNRAKSYDLQPIRFLVTCTQQPSGREHLHSPVNTLFQQTLIQQWQSSWRRTGTVVPCLWVSPSWSSSHEWWGNPSPPWRDQMHLQDQTLRERGRQKFCFSSKLNLNLS